MITFLIITKLSLIMKGAGLTLRIILLVLKYVSLGVIVILAIPYRILVRRKGGMSNEVKMH